MWRFEHGDPFHFIFVESVSVSPSVHDLQGGRGDGSPLKLRQGQRLGMVFCLEDFFVCKWDLGRRALEEGVS